MTTVHRRMFLQQCVAHSAAGGLAATVLAPHGRSCGAADPPSPHPATTCIFTESFQDMPIPEVCRLFRELGVDGLDLTVRPGGHIRPEDADQQLPEAVRAAEEAGVKIVMLTTGITDADEPSGRLLELAGRLGIQQVKLGYYRYEPFGNLAEQMDRVRARLEGVVELAVRHNVLPCVHIHSGPMIPSHGTMLYQLIRDFEPQQLGAYVDPLHMTLEGGGDGWRQGLDLLRPWIRISSIKNFWWEKLSRDAVGQQQWRPRLCPVADGVASIPEFVRALKSFGFAGVYTVHSEYKSGSSFRSMSTAECIEQTRVDLEFIRRCWQAA